MDLYTNDGVERQNHITRKNEKCHNLLFSYFVSYTPEIGNLLTRIIYMHQHLAVNLHFQRLKYELYVNLFAQISKVSSNGEVVLWLQVMGIDSCLIQY